MKKVLSILLVAVMLLSVLPISAMAADYPYTGNAYGKDFAESDADIFEAGDVIALIGDSITHGSTKSGFTNTSWFVQLDYYLITRFPELRVKTTNLGISGISTVQAARYQLTTDYNAHDYNKVIVYLGTNDGNASYDKETVLTAYTKVLDYFEGRKAQVISLITPVGVDEEVRTSSHNNYALEKVSNEIVKYSGEQRGIPVAYQFTDFQSTFPIALAQKNIKCLQDGIHPSAAGSSITFAALVQALNLPGEVATVVIDGESVAKQSNCEVTNFKNENGNISYTYFAHSLPFAQTSYVRDASEIMDYMDKFSRETLQVKGLASGTYDLKIDGKFIATLTAQQLAEGVNLALYITPMTEQAQKVASEVFKLTEATRALRTLEYTRFQVRRQNIKEESIDKMIEFYAKGNTANASLYQSYLDSVAQMSLEDRWAQLDTYWESSYDLAQPTAHEVTLSVNTLDTPVNPGTPDKPDTPDTPDTPDVPGENKNGTVWIIVAAAAVVVAVAVAVIAVVAKKKKK